MQISKIKVGEFYSCLIPNGNGNPNWKTDGKVCQVIGINKETKRVRVNHPNFCISIHPTQIKIKVTNTINNQTDEKH